jgi:hypothetical protein
MGVSYHNSYHPLMHKLITCLREFDLPSQSDHRFEGGTPK